MLCITFRLTFTCCIQANTWMRAALRSLGMLLLLLLLPLLLLPLLVLPSNGFAQSRTTCST